jgi:hypothetical protein
MFQLLPGTSKTVSGTQNLERNVPNTAHTNVPTISLLLGTLFLLVFPVDFKFLNGFELPYYIGLGKYQKEVEKDAVNTMNKAISGFLEKNNNSRSGPFSTNCLLKGYLCIPNSWST